MLVMDDTGTKLSEQRYLPFGEVRTDVGTAITQTDFGYTGQRNYTYINLMDYRARFYSPYLARFLQADTIVPNPANSQSWNRYSYVRNSPIMYNDPTGHKEDGECGYGGWDCGGYADDPGKLEDDLDSNEEINNGESSEQVPQDLCRAWYGPEDCQQWDEIFDPWYYYPTFYPDDFKSITKDYMDEYIGIEELLFQGKECHLSNHSEFECNNQFWTMEDQSGINKFYISWQFGMNFKYGNQLMEFVLKEVNADPYRIENWDPAWIYAITETDPVTFQVAKNKAFNYWNNQGYISEWGNEMLELIQVRLGGE
jgi:RHS repeat-associated protein